MKTSLKVALVGLVSVVVVGATILFQPQQSHKPSNDKAMELVREREQQDAHPTFSMDAGQAVVLFILLLFGSITAVGVICVKRTVVPPIRQAKQEVDQTLTDWNKARIERYNNLPALGKARVDKRNARIIKYGGAVSAVGAIGIMRLINPLGLVPMLMTGYRARRNWKEQSNAIAEADQRREQILNPPAPVGDQAPALPSTNTRNYWDPN
jgi:hypothetical protein